MQSKKPHQSDYIAPLCSENRPSLIPLLLTETSSKINKKHIIVAYGGLLLIVSSRPPVKSLIFHRLTGKLRKILIA
jgi:hypothetical protein